MKKKLLLLMLVISIILVGCQGNVDDSTEGGEAENSTEEGSAEETKEGGRLTISLTSSPKNLDPIKYTGTYESQIMQSVLDTLVAYKMDLSEIVPSIAESWAVSDDGREYTFQLREDVYFHPGEYQDGRQVVAEDIKYSLERSNELSAMNRLDMIDSVEVVDDFEVIIHLPEPDASFLTALTNYGNGIVPKEEVDGWGDDFGNHLVGSGPFMMNEFKFDEEAILDRNDNYWAQKPHLDGVTFKVITDINQNANSLRTGEVDFSSGLKGESVEMIRQDENIQILEMPELHVAYVYFNQVNGPTADKEVRKALIKAIDSEELYKGVYQHGEASHASLPLPPGSWGYDEDVESIVPTYEPEVAKEILADAGYPDGFKTTIHITDESSRVKAATIIQEQLKTNLNIDLDIEMSEWGTFSEIGASGEADIFAMSWSWYPDPSFFLDKMFASSSIGSLGNGQGFSDEEVDKLLEEALRETDQDERAVIYKEALAKIVEEYPGIFYANENVMWGLTPEVQGVTIRADGSIFLVNEEVNVWKK